MLSTDLRHGFPIGLFPSGSPSNNLYVFLFSVILADNNNSIQLNSIQFFIIYVPSQQPQGQ
jgi:hypothetical protein